MQKVERWPLRQALLRLCACFGGRGRALRGPAAGLQIMRLKLFLKRTNCLCIYCKIHMFATRSLRGHASGTSKFCEKWRRFKWTLKRRQSGG
jgi:hypothetical protein